MLLIEWACQALYAVYSNTVYTASMHSGLTVIQLTHYLTHCLRTPSLLRHSQAKWG
jgi:hypothetical protein